MRIRNFICVFMLAGLCAFAQQGSSSSQEQQAAPSKDKAAPAPQQEKQVQPAEANPFPKEKSQKAQDSAPGKEQAAAAPQQEKKESPSEANPFPEEKSRKAEDAANGAKPGSASVSSSHVDLSRFAPDASRETRISNGAGGYIHDPKLAATDEKVGNFYLQTGAYKGAYDRFKEATLVAPEDANAVFGLAQSARGLGLDKVAITNYMIYLEAVPDGKHAKDARKALKELNDKSKK
jgi:hypothetical protein